MVVTITFFALTARSASDEASYQTSATGYPIVGTGQTQCYDTLDEIVCPQAGEPFYGQDACHQNTEPMYLDNGDGTVTDLNSELVWQKTPGDKVTFNEAVSAADTFSLGGYDDWRLPTIKELYSLIDFRGIDPSGWDGDTTYLRPFIDTDFFDFAYGDTDAGERIIDAQYWSATPYVSTTMMGDATVFGVNFADGRIKGYPRDFGPLGDPMTEFVRYVRGNPDYGVNEFVDNGDSTVSDMATGLMWMKYDSDAAMNWEAALDYAENLTAAGYDNWRLPSAKELQSIVDYSRSPATTGSAAIDTIFFASQIIDEGGGINYPFYWTGTTHTNWTQTPGYYAAYVAFGEALGFLEVPPGSGNYVLLDVHGAGAQRSDPKSGDPADWPFGHGPQGDVIRIYNYVRCVRDIVVEESSCGDADNDGQINIGDAVYIINYIFKEGPPPSPVCQGYANGDDAINIGDAVYVLEYVFKDGPSPVAGCCP